jgi:hypothetical protein
MTPHVDTPFPWAPALATALFVVLTIWAFAARKKR